MKEPKDTGGGNNDWIEPFKTIVKDKFNKIVEFGCGTNSTYLMDNCHKLHSIEIVVRDDQQGWAEYVEELLKDKNHKMSVITHKDKYDKKLEIKINKVFEKDYDVAFVDSGSHCRAELVNYCFKHKIPYILAHDTSHGFVEYGWDKIVVPEDYEVKEYSQGQGTKIWIKK